jgi:primosomal protein N'
MAQCPACDQPLLSCIRKHQQYLFCTHCRGEMPHFTVAPPPAAACRLSDRLAIAPAGTRSVAVESAIANFIPQPALTPAV